MKQLEASNQEDQLTIDQEFEQLKEERKMALLSELESIALTQTTSLTLQKEQLEKIQQNISHYTCIYLEMTSPTPYKPPEHNYLPYLPGNTSIHCFCYFITAVSAQRDVVKKGC